MRNDPFQLDLDGQDGQNRQPNCLACEALFVDALDGTLDTAEQSFFDRHLRSCVACANAYAEAQRGAAWLEMLKTPRPQPRPELLASILAQTSGSAEQGSLGRALPLIPATPGAMLIPQAAPAGRLLAFRPPSASLPRLGRILLEPRLAMTAAMAFFSITLTMSLTGVRLGDLHASDLTPSHLRRTAHGMEAGAVRYYDNLRVVHVLESRVEDLRENLQQYRQEETPVTPDPAPALNDHRPEAPPAGGSSSNHPRNDTRPAIRTSLVSLIAPRRTPNGDRT